MFKIKFKKKFLLSIIIPCYNNEKYIRKSLESVTNNKSDLTEIIVINDGSNDNSLKIIKNYINKNKLKNVKVISHKNHGPGYSRNIGIKKSQGEYIAFLDSDDLFINNFLPKIIPIVQKCKYDIIEFGFFRFYNSLKNGLKTYKPIYDFEGCYLLKKILLDIFSKTVWYPSTRIYKKKLWKNIKFPDSLYYEDQMTIYKVFMKAKTIFFLKKPFLAYRFTKTSITENIDKKHINDLISFYFSIKNKDDYLKIMKLRVARTISYMRYKLNFRINDYKKIKKEILLMHLNIKIIRKLYVSDIIYFLFPNFYDFFNRYRIKKVKFFY